MPYAATFAVRLPRSNRRNSPDLAIWQQCSTVHATDQELNTTMTLQVLLMHARPLPSTGNPLWCRDIAGMCLAL